MLRFKFSSKKSKVILHTDNHDLARACTDLFLWAENPRASRTANNPIMLKIMFLLGASLERHQIVDAVAVNDRIDDAKIAENMRLAHNASVQGSGSSAHKYDPKAASNMEALETGSNTPIQWPPKVIEP